MRFSELRIGELFVLPNHIPTRDGIPSPEETGSLEVFEKIETLESGVNAGTKRNGVPCKFSDNARVIKLIC